MSLGGVLSTSLVSHENSFDVLFSETVDEVFASLFGDRIGDELFVLLQSKHHIPREEIPDRPNDFELALKGILGPDAVRVSRIIAERLYSKLGLEFTDAPNRSFVEYVSEARLLLATSARWHSDQFNGQRHYLGRNLE